MTVEHHRLGRESVEVGRADPFVAVGTEAPGRAASQNEDDCFHTTRILPDRWRFGPAVVRKEEDRDQRTEDSTKQKTGTERPVMQINSAKELTVYKKAFELGQLAFELSLRFPKEETYALTSQLRRSSRSICLNLR